MPVVIDLKQTGFTLVEAAITFVTAAIVMGSISMVIISAHKHFDRIWQKRNLQQDFFLIERLLTNRVRASVKGLHAVYSNYAAYEAGAGAVASGTCLRLYLASDKTIVFYQDGSSFKIIDERSQNIELVTDVVTDLLFVDQTSYVETRLSLNQEKWSISDTLVAAFRNLTTVSQAQGDGLLGSYFPNTSFAGTPTTRVDETIDFNWGTGEPISGLGSDTFSIRWTGKVKAFTTETYTFYTQSDEGVRLWIDDNLIIDKWVNQTVTEWSADVDFDAGVSYSIKLEYYEDTNDAVCQLYWSSPAIAKEIVPKRQLYSE